jgi:hypothetical protein
MHGKYAVCLTQQALNRCLREGTAPAGWDGLTDRDGFTRWDEVARWDEPVSIYPLLDQQSLQQGSDRGQLHRFYPRLQSGIGVHDLAPGRSACQIFPF